MNDGEEHAQAALWPRWRAVADLYHAFFTGLILTVVTRRGTADAAQARKAVPLAQSGTV